MNVLSLFDGISAGQLALQRAGIVVDNYFASEIDKYAIKITQKNFPNTIQLGNIKNWKEWQLPKIDMIIGGSPCQGFSSAGKGLNFEDPRSKLFFVFVDILKYNRNNNNEIIFLLENVKMKKEWIDIISGNIGVSPVLINSALLSAQSRKRLYWTNLNIDQPNDKNIYLKDIIENNVDEKYFYSEKAISYLDRNKINKRFVVYQDDKKSSCVTANFQKSLPYNVYVDKEKSNCITSNFSNMALVNYNKSQGQVVFYEDKPKQIDTLYPNNAQAGRIYSLDGESVTLKSDGGGLGAKTGLYEDSQRIRRLTPIECERLQTFPDNYTEGISNTQRYKSLGNSWTVDVIAHIFSFI